MKLLIVLFLFICASCSPSIYWESSKRTASGKHTYYSAGWPYQYSCKSYSQQPIKVMTFKRYSYWRHGN